MLVVAVWPLDSDSSWLSLSLSLSSLPDKDASSSWLGCTGAEAMFAGRANLVGTFSGPHYASRQPSILKGIGSTYTRSKQGRKDRVDQVIFRSEHGSRLCWRSCFFCSLCLLGFGHIVLLVSCRFNPAIARWLLEILVKLKWG